MKNLIDRSTPCRPSGDEAPASADVEMNPVLAEILDEEEPDTVSWVKA